MNNILKYVEIKDFSISHYDATISNVTDIEHYHNSYEIALFLKADVRIFVKDIQYCIGEGDILLINEYDIHKVIYTKNTAYERFVINFRKDYVNNLLKSLNVDYIFKNLSCIKNKKISTNLKERYELKKLFLSILKDSNNISICHNPILEAQLKMNLVNLLIKVFRLINNRDESIKLTKTDEQVKEIIIYIDDNYSNNITLDNLSQLFYLNKYYISHIFKNVTGLTVVKYIQHKRIIEAQKMLRNSSTNILNIAHSCGFNNIQHFCRVFKEISKTTPKQYRKKHEKTPIY